MHILIVRARVTCLEFDFFLPDQWPEELYDYAANKVLHPDVAALDLQEVSLLKTELLG